MNIYEAIKSLVEFGVKENLIETEDKVWAVNRILEILNMDSMETDAEVKEQEAYIEGAIDGSGAVLDELSGR